MRVLTRRAGRNGTSGPGQCFGSQRIGHSGRDTAIGRKASKLERARASTAEARDRSAAMKWCRGATSGSSGAPDSVELLPLLLREVDFECLDAIQAVRTPKGEGIHAGTDNDVLGDSCRYGLLERLLSVAGTCDHDHAGRHDLLESDPRHVPSKRTESNREPEKRALQKPVVRIVDYRGMRALVPGLFKRHDVRGREILR